MNCETSAKFMEKILKKNQKKRIKFQLINEIKLK